MTVCRQAELLTRHAFRKEVRDIGNSSQVTKFEFQNSNILN